jgi:hypothetical protein
MNQILRGNKLKDCFETLKDHTWKSMRREKKKRNKREKVVGVKLEVCWLHVLSRNRGAIEMIWTPPWKILFGRRKTPLASSINDRSNNLFVDAYMAYVSYFLINIYIYKITKFPLNQLYYNKKMNEKYKNTLESKFSNFCF